MKILIINSSPRKAGNTQKVCQIISDKLNSFGNVEIEHILLSDINLQNCKGCCNCLTIGEDFCPQKNDERLMLEKKLLSADGVIFASPVYAMNMPAVMKNFMDRFAFSMHRPRFFNQYTMIIAITGAFGTNETIQSISQLKYCGFNIVKKLGIKAPNPLENIEFTDKKLIKKIETEIESFYNTIKNKEKVKPSIMNLTSFNLQRKFFSRLNPEKYADWKYFEEKGWFDSNVKYFTQNAGISPFKNTIAKLLCKMVK